MSAATLSGVSLAHAHNAFLAALPAMEHAIRFGLRNVPKHCRAEAIGDARAACWHAWYGLLRRGKDPMAVGPTGIAANAVRYVRNGRQLGTGTGGRGAMDVYSQKAQKKLGLKLISLDRHTGTEPAARPDAWRELLAQDYRFGPADEAAFKIDFERWLAGLSARKRQMAELLAEGHETGVVARTLGVTPAAVSITRTWLEASWRDFQGETAPASAAAVRRPCGRPRKEERGARARTKTGRTALVAQATAL